MPSVGGMIQPSSNRNSPAGWDVERQTVTLTFPKR